MHRQAEMNSNLIYSAFEESISQNRESAYNYGIPPMQAAPGVLITPSFRNFWPITPSYPIFSQSRQHARFFLNHAITPFLGITPSRPNDAFNG